MASVGGMENIDESNFPSIYDYYRRHVKNWSHEQMAAHYRKTIVQGLNEYDNDQHSDAFYEDLAWRGLEKTSSWDQLVSSSDSTRIIQTYQQLLNEPGSTQCNN